jgi:hypothetical protein
MRAITNTKKASMVSIQSFGSTASNFWPWTASELRRGEYFAGLFIVGCANGFASRVVHSVEAIGWADALFRTFGISVIVLASCVAGISLVMRDPGRGVSPWEIAVGSAFFVLVIIPIGPLSWIAVTGLSLFILLSSDVAATRSGAVILLATTVPMLWSRMVFQFFANFILAADASLVSWLLGTQRSGNMVEFADRSGQLVIFPACSSLANVSLAFLCWVTLSQVLSHRRSTFDLFWCLLACSAVIAVNVIRMTILGLSDWHYAEFHNQWGDSIVNVIILILIVGISALGVRRELVQSI